MPSVNIDKERCKGCGLCISVCPAKALKLSEDMNAKGYQYAIYTEGCTGCRQCYIICPDVCIEVKDGKGSA